MTVSSTSNRVVYAGNGTTTAFPFAFKVSQSADLVVVYTDAAGSDTVLSPSVYGASGFDLDAGGTVTYPLSGSPIASGTKLTIYRDVPATQPASISNQGAMWPNVIEKALDRLTFVAQKVADTVGRSLAIGPTDSGTMTIPIAASRAAKVLAFDGSGNAAVSNLTLAALEGGSVAAAASAAAAATSATAAASSASGAASSATAAAGSATTASTQATNAATSATAAGSSATSAASSATSASSSASSAATQASNAGTSASNASTSATNAAASASGASTSASAASSSASSASTQATNAATSATAAAASAALASSYVAALTDTSTTSLAIATGSKTFTISAGKQFASGQFIVAASNANPANYMHGQVTSYSGTSLVVNVLDVGGSGTKADWNLSVSGSQGTAGANGTNGTNGITSPQGRLTLTSGMPVLTGSVSGASTVYYALRNGNQMPIYDGSSAFASTTFTELSNVLANSSSTKAGPAAAVANACYDLYGWSDSGTVRLTRSDFWKKAGATITMTIASPCVVTHTGHGLTVDFDYEPVVFSTTGALPTGISAGTVYFIKYVSANTYNLYTSPGGSVVNTSGSQSGAHTATIGDRTGATALAASGNCERQLVLGLMTNKNAITNGPGANLGTYRARYCQVVHQGTNELSSWREFLESGQCA